MARERGRLVALAVALVCLAATLWWQFVRQDSSPAPAAQGAAAAGATAKDAVRAVPPVALNRLKRDAVEPSDIGRDPFRFAAGRGASGGRGAGGRGGPGATVPGAGHAPPAAETPAPPAVVVPVGPPPPPPIQLKFIALVVTKKTGTRIAMMTDGRGVYSGVEGAVIEGRYRLLKVGNDAIEVAYLDGRGRRTIPLSGT